MRYTVELNYFQTGSGYQYSEDFDEGQTEKPFTAREWLNMLDEPIDVDPAGGWIEVVVRFYDADGNEIEEKRSYVNKTLR